MNTLQLLSKVFDKQGIPNALHTTTIYLHPTYELSRWHIWIKQPTPTTITITRIPTTNTATSRTITTLQLADPQLLEKITQQWQQYCNS